MTPTPDTMDLFTEMNLEPAPLPAYFNTVSERGAKLKEYIAKATSQTALVMAAMVRLKTAGPSQVYKDLGGAFLLTSVRRSMTNLSDNGMLTKTADKVMGMNGRDEHVWSLPKEQAA